MLKPMRIPVFLRSLRFWRPLPETNECELGLAATRILEYSLSTSVIVTARLLHEINTLRVSWLILRTSA